MLETEERKCRAHCFPRFVPQANRSLRSYNMYLNTRTMPRRSLFHFGRRATSNFPNRAIEKDGATRFVRSPSVAAGSNGTARRLHIPTIPPSSNPRGELIFSSKVPATFREGYERYRSAFEKRRMERLAERRRSGWRAWWIFGRQQDTTKSQMGAPSRTTGSVHQRNNIRTSPKTTKRQVNAPLGGSGSQHSSRASSQASLPPSFSHEDGSRNQAEITSDDSSSVPQSRGRTRASSATSLSERHSVGQEPRASQDGISSQDENDALLPNITTVASRDDDRSTAVATLREPVN